MDVEIRSAIRSKRTVWVFRIKWWNPTVENVTKLYQKVKAEGTWRLERDINKIWEAMIECIRRLARKILGVSMTMKGAWWWSEEMKEKVKMKEEKYRF